MGFKFIHTADWHLGMQAGFLPAEARARFAQDRFDALRAIAALATEEGCAFVVVAGDVFDSNHIDRATIARALEALATFSVPVFLLAGNHDPLDPASVYRNPAWVEHKPPNVIVFEDSTPLQVPALRDVQIVGVPWATKSQLVDPLAAAYAESPSSTLRVVVGHGHLDLFNPGGDDPSLIRVQALREALADGRAHYVALGDRHSVTQVAGTQGRAYYAGTPMATDYGETEPNHVLLVELSHESCRVQPREIGSWRFVQQQFELNGEEDIQALDDWLSAIAQKHTTPVKLVLRGTLTLALNALLEDTLDRHRLTFASLNTWERHSDLVSAPDQLDIDTLNVSGYVRETLDTLLVMSGRVDDAQSAAAGDALNLLYRLAQ